MLVSGTAGLAVILVPATVVRTWPDHPRVWVFGAFSLLALAASKISFSAVGGARGRYTPGCLIVVLAGLIGGPPLGVAAALVAAHRFRDVRANVFWSAEAALVGCAAGTIGVAPWPLPVRVVAAFAAVQLITLSALVVVARIRRINPAELDLRGQANGLLVELVLASPLLIVLADTYTQRPRLVVLTVVALLAAVAIASRGRALFLLEIDAERTRARTDSLTGLLNRRGSVEALDREHARVRRSAAGCGLLLVDFDRFHWINRTYDLVGGDKVLRELSQRLARELRASDTVGRWGGEELIVLAPDLDAAALGVLAEKVRRLIRDTPVQLADDAVTITCSVGGTMLDAASLPEVSVLRAERALKHAKEQRDTVCVDSTEQTRSGVVHETQVDALTGLLNRQALAQLVLPREIERALQTAQPVSLLMVDVDNLKELNDLFGHTVGDHVLAGVGDTIVTIVNREELVFRVGGDEFAIILPLPLEEARTSAETLRAAVARRAFANEEELPSAIARVTCSIGIAELVETSARAEPQLAAQHLVSAAETALLDAKRDGGDRIAGYRPDPVERTTPAH